MSTDLGLTQQIYAIYRKKQAFYRIF